MSGLYDTLDADAVPMGNMPDAEDRRVIERKDGNVPSNYDEVLTGEAGEVERALALFVEEKYRQAQNKTIGRRSQFDRMYADVFGDIPTADDTGLANLVTPYVGNKSRRMAVLVAARVIPDRELMNFFTLGGGVGMSDPDPEMIRKRMRDSVLGTRVMEEFLRIGRFDDSIDRLLCQYFAMGNSVSSWEWIQEWSCEETDAMGMDELPEEYGPNGEMPEGFDFYGSDAGRDTEEVVRLIRQYPRCRVIDLRNFMPSSLYCAGGAEELDWYCEYDTTRWRHLRQNRIRRGGQGCYANTELFSPASEGEIVPIADDIWGGMFQGGGVRFSRYTWLDKGLITHRYVGPIHVEEVMQNRRLPSKKAWYQALRKFNPTYKGGEIRKLNGIPWFLLENQQGVLTRCQPYPYYRGQRNPLEHDRWMVDQGYTYGRGMYANGVSVGQWVANYMDHLEISAAELSVKPPVATVEDEIDPAWQQRRGGAVYNWPPGAIIKLTMGGDASKAFQFMPPNPALVEQLRITKAGVISRLDQNTTVTAAVEGAQPGQGTATQAIQDANFAMAYVEHEARRWSRSIARRIEKLGLVIDEYATESIAVQIESSSQRELLAGYDDDVADQMENINATVGAKLMGTGALYATMQNDGFFGDMQVRCLGPMMGGGASQRAQSITAWIGQGMAMEKVSPGLVNYREALIQLAQTLDLPNPERMLNDVNAQQGVAAMNADLLAMQGQAQGMMGAKGASGQGGPAGEASPPAERGSNVPLDNIVSP